MENAAVPQQRTQKKDISGVGGKEIKGKRERNARDRRVRLGEKRWCFCMCRRVAVKQGVSGEREEKVVALVAGVPALRIISPVRGVGARRGEGHRGGGGLLGRLTSERCGLSSVERCHMKMARFTPVQWHSDLNGTLVSTPLFKKTKPNRWHGASGWHIHHDDPRNICHHDLSTQIPSKCPNLRSRIQKVITPL